MPETKQDVINKWTIKNERRRDAKKANPRLYAEGRYNRRSLATNGAFGQLTAKLHNMCVIGTSANGRNDKKSKEDFETSADYDR